MNIMDYEFVLANLEPMEEKGCHYPSAYNLYPTMEAAEADMERANKGMDSWGPYKAMTWDAYKAGERNYYLSKPAKQITAEKWDEMLNILPPMCWMQESGYNSFLMSEMLSSSYTHQFVRYGHGERATYWDKIVDSRDRSTWLQPGMSPADKAAAEVNVTCVMCHKPFSYTPATPTEMQQVCKPCTEKLIQRRMQTK